MVIKKQDLRSLINQISSLHKEDPEDSFLTTMASSGKSDDELKAAALELLPGLKEQLGEKAKGISDAALLKFLLWKPSVERAVGRFDAHLKWRKEVPWAFDDPTILQASKDESLRRVLESEVLVAPEGAVAKDGSTVIFGRLRNNDMTDGRTVQDVIRMILYTIDRILERDATQLHGVTIFHDLKGVTTNNIHTGIPKILFSAIIGHFPIRIAAIYILNAPLFVRGIFKVISLTMPTKVRNRMYFVSDMDQILKAIDQDTLLPEHGGKCQHDQKEWVANQIQRETDGTMGSLQECVKPESVAATK